MEEKKREELKGNERGGMNEGKKRGRMRKDAKKKGMDEENGREKKGRN